MSYTIKKCWVKNNLGYLATEHMLGYFEPAGWDFTQRAGLSLY